MTPLNFLKYWSGRQDSNLRPLGPEPSALPGCATPRLEIDLPILCYRLPGVKLQRFVFRVSFRVGLLSIQ